MASSSASIAMKPHIYELLVVGYGTHVRDQATYTQWRAALVGWLRGRSVPFTETAIPTVYVADMRNPLLAYTETTFVFPGTKPAATDTLLEKLKAVEEDEKKTKREKASEADNTSNEVAIVAATVASVEPKLSPNAMRALCNHPPAGPGISADDLKYALVTDYKNVFACGYWRLKEVFRPDGIVEVLRFYMSQATGKWHNWTQARIVRVNTETRVITVDPYILDPAFAGDENFYLTYGMDSYAIRPIVFNHDTFYRSDHKNFDPAVHLCAHITNSTTFTTKVTDMSRGTNHTACMHTVIAKRALHGVDVVFVKDSTPNVKF